MRFNDHTKLAGLHAFLGASNYHWINYTDQKLEARFYAQEAAQRGTRIHNWAHETIKLGFVQPDEPKTVNMYVNDAIGFRMTCEQPLMYSENAFGTADTICFRKSKGRYILRIHDLKTGLFSTSEKQLEVYAALFCLEYKFKPMEIEIELRIYQNNEVRIYTPDPDFIAHIMDRIVTADKQIRQLRAEAE